MKKGNYQNSLNETLEQTSLADIVEKWEEKCKNCHPLTPLACVTNCKIWKQKNELRRLCEKIKNPDYVTELLNVLKNKRRFQILKILSEGRHPIAQIQQELKKLGYYHSRRTIVNEYITPLIEVGLVEENQANQYYLTLFGCQLNDPTKKFDIGDVLPPHSECYEENSLSLLTRKPQTTENLKTIIPPKSITRILKRLQKSGLIEASKENNYVFFFRTKRNPNNAKFSPTERRIYENIPAEGISARKLAEKTEISLRRTYKYLRRLKGKKLVFTRTRPKSYGLTAKGFQVAMFLKRMRDLVVEALSVASIVTKEDTPKGILLDTCKTKIQKKKKNIPFATAFNKKN